MLGRNRFHPKNIYKNPPNFSELAIQYPEFRKYVKQELSGRITIDYQNQRALKELTKTLLKKDFDLDVDIDDTRLIPRLPLCLNYVLWIEDLLDVLQTVDSKSGIDIGTGNVCIYALLGARRGWNMLATETDLDNFKSAQNNITKNNLLKSVSLKLVENSKQLLLGVLNDNFQYDFCMCNPPFYDFGEKPLNRTTRRPRLGTSPSDIQTEICTEGGEILFIKQLIEESVILKEKIKIYTTLVGKKVDFLLLKKELQKINAKSVAFTEFCQGRTTRWGIAWTFLDISLNSSEKLKREKKNIKSSLSFVVPETEPQNLDAIFSDVKNVLSTLKIIFKEENTNASLALSFRAYNNTWSHQRQKRRLEARLKSKCETRGEEAVINDNFISPKRLKLEDNENSSTLNDFPLVEGFILLKPENSSVIFEISWLSGKKELLHQIFQYFKNHWNKKSNNC